MEPVNCASLTIILDLLLITWNIHIVWFHIYLFICFFLHLFGCFDLSKSSDKWKKAMHISSSRAGIKWHRIFFNWVKFLMHSRRQSKWMFGFVKMRSIRFGWKNWRNERRNKNDQTQTKRRLNENSFEIQAVALHSGFWWSSNELRRNDHQTNLYKLLHGFFHMPNSSSKIDEE